MTSPLRTKYRVGDPISPLSPLSSTYIKNILEKPSLRNQDRRARRLFPRQRVMRPGCVLQRKALVDGDLHRTGFDDLEQIVSAGLQFGGGAGVIGFNLLSGSTVEYSMKFTGGDTVWRLNDGGSDFSSGIPLVGNAQITFGFTFDGGNSYDVHITEGVNTYDCVGCVAADSVSNIDGVKFFDFGQGANQNFAFNLLSVPEPSTWIAAGLSGASCLLLGLRRRRLKTLNS